MADYYSEAAFIIPLKSDLADMALRALAIFDGEIPEQFLSKCALDEERISELPPFEQLVTRLIKMHPDYVGTVALKGNALHELVWSFRTEKQDDGLLLTHEDTFNADHAAAFTEAILKTFDLDLVVTFEVAHLASKPLLDAYGGLGVAVTKDGARYAGTYDFTIAEQDAVANKERYYQGNLVEVNGEYEYGSEFLFVCRDGEDPDKKFDDIMIDFRGDGEFTDENHYYVQTSDGLAIKKGGFQRIPPAEFKVLKKYLAVL